MLIRQMNATLNRKLKSIQHQLTAQQADLQQHLMETLQDVIHPPKEVPPDIVYKQLNVLFITPCNDRASSSISIIVEQSLRHLVKSIYEMKAIQPVGPYLERSKTDLVLVLGGEEGEILPEESMEALRTSPVKKALWLTDLSGVKHSKSFISIFDYVFTQKAENIPTYGRMSNARCYEVPFPPNPNVYYPQSVLKQDESDVYIIGDAQPGSSLVELANHALLSGKVVRVEGKGWKRFGSFIPVHAHEDRAALYNGSKMVIQDNSPVRSVLEVAACGTFQLNSITTNRNLDTDVFQSYNSQEELIEKFDFYWNRVDQRRLAASRAMAYVTYNHSYLQSSLQLLDRIFR
ncbi:hypothetical protein ACINKY_05050 [Paenibacillus illinoisensis]|uniref:Spore protein YkvP/CgeB glycosyl transferase-like domain-containing protein n=1 Tax=Paenibacillus illinoisensis TaxID=59845 RepID=A0ABW8HPI0_9BACL